MRPRERIFDFLRRLARLVVVSQGTQPFVIRPGFSPGRQTKVGDGAVKLDLKIVETLVVIRPVEAQQFLEAEENRITDLDRRTLYGGLCPFFDESLYGWKGALNAGPQNSE